MKEIDIISPGFGSGPTSCIARPGVIRSIRDSVKKGRFLSSADVRLALNMGILKFPSVGRTGFNDGLVFPPSYLKELMSGGLAPSKALSRASLDKPKGQMKALVLMVDFSDNVGTAKASHFENLLFDASNPDSMTSFYHDLSYGNLNVSGEVKGWIRAPHPYSYYTAGESGTGSDPARSTPGLLKDALDIYCKSSSFKGFDLNGDGFLDGLFLIHAGAGAEAEPDPELRAEMIWSHKWTLRDPYENSGIRGFAYFTAPEDGNLGVFAHEFGHFLGLPDLYDTSYRSSGIGDWCLMAGGSWNGGGLAPARMSAWCLEQLGWIKPKTVSAGQLLNLKPLDQRPGDCYKLKIGTDNSEYLLLENRQQSGRDHALPGHGLALWHIDMNQPDNTNPLAFRVALIQADGERHLEFGTNSGDDADLFPGSGKVTKVNDSRTEHPNTRSNDGTKTGIGLSKITEKNGEIGVTVRV